MTPGGGGIARAALLALGVVALGLVGCNDDSDRRSSPPPSSTTAAEAIAGAPLTGRVFVLAGEQSLAYDIYEVSSPPLRLNRLSSVARVSALGGCPSTLAVAAAQVEVGLTDTIQVFRDGRFHPVDGLGAPKGFSPALNPADCRMAYTDVDRSTSELVQRLHVWDPRTRTGDIIERGNYLSGVQWGPGGRLAVVLNEGGDPGQKVVSTAMVIVAPDGSKKSLPAPAPDVGALVWAPSESMAFVRVDAKATLFINPDTGARSELAGWWPVAWSPDGKQLLVSDAQTHKELGVVAASDLGTVQRVGTAPVGVYGGVWLPSDAGPI